ncbi:hypothetical protein JHK84_056059 [Glycine max]|nr:hypothetical protein JHK84_056059 [Glycine max]
MPAIDMTRRRDEINLSNLAINKIQQSAFSELVDPCLGFDSDSEVKRMMVSVAELAFQCLQRDKELRPSMDEVLKVLMRIETGKDMGEHPDDVEDLRPPSLPSPDWDENGLVRKMMVHPSPKAVTDTWHSESTTPNGSGSEYDKKNLVGKPLNNAQALASLRSIEYGKTLVLLQPENGIEQCPSFSFS